MPHVTRFEIGAVAVLPGLEAASIACGRGREGDVEHLTKRRWTLGGERRAAKTLQQEATGLENNKPKKR
ncbi:hypothetical protein HYQ44_006122 [Verticillium longisporum]|nr:hypothetical protein HYQ44_006122 [Verticillium longisporum]